MNSVFFIPTVSSFGSGCSKEIGDKLKLLKAKKPLIVTDKGLVAAGIVDQISKHIKDAGLDCVIFDQTVPNPTDKNCHDGLEMYNANKCDSIVTVGGGSPHDCGKGVGLLVGNGGNIRDYAGIDQSKNPMPPFIAINTTAGTASEMTRFCIITNTETLVKMAIVDWHTTPTFAINDPDLMAGKPPALTAATGMDALTHAIEAYVSIAATPITDACALMAIDLVVKYLPKAVSRGSDLDFRDKMAYGQFLAGMAFNNASLGYVHAMAHQLGGLYDLPHGVCNAILLPHVCEYNVNSATERFATIAKHMGVAKAHKMNPREAAFAGIDAIKTLSKAVNIPAGLKGLGVKEKDFELMAGNAMKDACCFTNPRTATLEEVVGIFKAAM